MLQIIQEGYVDIVGNQTLLIFVFWLIEKKFTLPYVMSSFVMPLPFLYSKILGNGCVQFKSFSYIHY